MMQLSWGWDKVDVLGGEGCYRAGYMGASLCVQESPDGEWVSFLNSEEVGRSASLAGAQSLAMAQVGLESLETMMATPVFPPPNHDDVALIITDDSGKDHVIFREVVHYAQDRGKRTTTVCGIMVADWEDESITWTNSVKLVTGCDECEEAVAELR